MISRRFKDNLIFTGLGIAGLASFGLIGWVLVQAHEPPFECTGKVYEMVHRPGAEVTEFGGHWSKGEWVVGYHTKYRPEAWFLDVVDEAGDTHRLKVTERAFDGCVEGDWYSTNTEQC